VVVALIDTPPNALPFVPPLVLEMREKTIAQAENCGLALAGMHWGARRSGGEFRFETSWRNQ
jgi:hypothetical protein